MFAHRRPGLQITHDLGSGYVGDFLCADTALADAGHHLGQVIADDSKRENISRTQCVLRHFNFTLLF